jgi:hypothetical protein
MLSSVTVEIMQGIIHTANTCCHPPSEGYVLSSVQAEVFGPSVAYVDDAGAMEAQLKELVPSLQHVLADVLHVMKRVNETLAPHHPKIGECCFEQFIGLWTVLS